MNKRKRKKKIYKSTIIFIVLDILAFTGFFITYGPFSYLRNLYVTTAMKTMHHQYLAYVFYSEEMVENIMSKNYFVPIGEDVNLDDITIDTAIKLQR